MTVGRVQFLSRPHFCGRCATMYQRAAEVRASHPGAPATAGYARLRHLEWWYRARAFPFPPFPDSIDPQGRW